LNFPDLIIAGIRVPRSACLSIEQDYTPVGAASLLRMGNGDGIIQSSEWGKLSTSITCTGWAPSGLDGINWKSPAGITIACIKPMSLIEAAVKGYALLGNRQVETEVDLVGNTATLTTVVGATQYKVEWLPILTCFCNGGVKPRYSSRGNEYAWSLEGEEL
jgi:hypothetical protein